MKAPQITLEALERHYDRVKHLEKLIDTFQDEITAIEKYLKHHELEDVEDIDTLDYDLPIFEDLFHFNLLNGKAVEKHLKLMEEKANIKSEEFEKYIQTEEGRQEMKDKFIKTMQNSSINQTKENNQPIINKTYEEY